AVIERVAAQNEPWKNLTADERRHILRAIAERLRAAAPDLARRMATEMGKPVKQGVSEVEKCAWACEYFAAEGARFLADETIATDAARSYVRYEPLGTVLAVMPWNFPLWQFFRFAAPALMAGNTILLKHASNVTGCALAVEKLLYEAGLPPDVFRVLLITARQVEHAIESPRVVAVTLTGSEAAGRSIGASAGRELKPAVLELGGSDPFIVLADADVDRAAREGAWARAQNAGQSCIAAKRFIVVASVYDAFLERFTEHMRALKIGDPLDPATDIGPLARRDLRDALHAQTAVSVAMGARAVLGGERPDGPGAFYPATILTGVTRGMPIWDEEVFGPVAAVMRVADAEQAIRAANDTRFGLGASLWTRDAGRAAALASRIEAGSVFINGMVKSDPRLPFGGVKDSGYGRELCHHGIREFVNAKVVWIAKS
ncbi:MAG: NAD-dependent succinate-semialdehyde dehydrogenase, partial [Vicinamibacteria bacterium]|nr:NAD-dependent succinate-semialdehyde dehydrogenase [Vicinamibacteria bacterium]